MDSVGWHDLPEHIQRQIITRPELESPTGYQLGNADIASLQRTAKSVNQLISGSVLEKDYRHAAQRAKVMRAPGHFYPFALERVLKTPPPSAHIAHSELRTWASTLDNGDAEKALAVLAKHLPAGQEIAAHADLRRRLAMTHPTRHTSFAIFASTLPAADAVRGHAELCDHVQSISEPASVAYQLRALADHLPKGGEVQAYDNICAQISRFDDATRSVAINRLASRIPPAHAKEIHAGLRAYANNIREEFARSNAFVSLAKSLPANDAIAAHADLTARANAIEDPQTRAGALETLAELQPRN